MRIRLLFIILLSGVCCLLAGCPIVAGTLDSLKKTGVSASDREALFPQTLKQFNEALMWGDVLLAATFATDDYRDQFIREQSKLRGKRKIIDGTIQSAIFKPGSWEAEALVAVRGYQIPVYIVEEKVERQEWTFSLASGWKLVSRKEI